MASFSWSLFAEKLADLGWRQKDFADRAFVSRTTVSSWQSRGSVPGPAYALACEWASRALVARADAEALAPEPNRPRGRPFGAGGHHGVWEPSATDHRPQEVDGDYRKRLERQEEADMDQGDGWGKG